MRRHIFQNLIVPLLAFEISIVAFLYYTRTFDFPNLLLNVLSEIFGIIITVWVVDRVLREHETNRWKNAKIKVSWRVEEFIHETLDHLVRTTDLQGITVGLSWTKAERLDLRNKLILAIDPELLNKNVDDRNNPYTRKLYEGLPTLENIQGFEKSTNKGYKIFEMFGNQLAPEVMDYLLRSLENLEYITSRFPFFLQSLEKTFAETATTEAYKETVKESIIVGMASMFYQTVRDLVHLHKVLNAET